MISAKQVTSRIVGKQELIQKCPCEQSDDIEQVGSSEANLIWVSNDKSQCLPMERGGNCNCYFA